jgi:hypothetical protein
MEKGPFVTPEVVKQVRERTDAPMMECKKALYISKGDVEEAVQMLLTYDWRLTRHSKLVTYDYDERGWEPN